MEDERDFHADRIPLPDFAHNWEAGCLTLFADADLRHIRFGEAPEVVRERLVRFNGGEDIPGILHILYAPADQVRRRLRLHGYTPTRVRELWQRERARHLDMLKRLTMDYPGDELEREIAELTGISFEDWALRQRGIRLERERIVHGTSLGLSLQDMFADLALHIDICSPEAIWVDLTELYESDFDNSLTVRENLARQDAEFDTVETSGNILVLTEGLSDARILESAIKRLYPEFFDMFGFVDFDGFKVEGGASLLVKMVKAFAGVRMEQRIVALFDNDAAGHEARLSLERIRLPQSMRVVTLPDVSIAKAYPTLGPEGLRTMDVNGSACAIEMFTGIDALSGPDGALRPVRWTGYNKPAGRYQGEIEQKAAAAEHFLSAMMGGEDASTLRARFPDMNTLLQTLFEAFNAE